MSEMEFDHPDKGDALYAMELSLSLEKACPSSSFPLASQPASPLGFLSSLPHLFCCDTAQDIPGTMSVSIPRLARGAGCCRLPLV